MIERIEASPPYIVAIGGGLRLGSTTEKALRLTLQVAQAAGARTELFTGPDLDLPPYAPERTERVETTLRLVEAMRAADGILIGSPAYHGGLSGLVKNAIDYAEDLKDDVRPYLDGRPVGCIATAAGWQGAASTLSAMRSIVHALRGWPTPMGAGIITSGPVFDDCGACLSPGLQGQLELIGRQVLEFATLRASASQT